MNMPIGGGGGGTTYVMPHNMQMRLEKGLMRSQTAQKRERWGPYM